MARIPAKGRYQSDLKRRAAKREPYELVLIVCEGQKTEPNYLNGLKQEYRLSNTNIQVVSGEYGNDPISLVKTALNAHKKEPSYDRLYCVFDRDGHTGYATALALINNSRQGKAGRFLAVTSVPCFEFWILLHYEHTTRPFLPAGGRSGCEQVLAAVQEHWPGYTKGLSSAFRELKSRLDVALDRARLVRQYNIDTASDNPATQMHELVTYLRNVKPAA